MSTQFWIWSHLSFFLILAVASVSLLGVFERRLVRGLCCLLLGAAVFIPFSGTDLSGYVLAHIGALSATSIVLFSHKLAVKLKLAHEQHVGKRAVANAVWLVAGVTLYTSSFGWISPDIYAIGYQSALPAVLLAASLVAAFFGYWLPAVSFVAAVNAHQWQCAESLNIWDYVIDPWLVLGAFVELAAAAFSLASTSLHRRNSDGNTDSSHILSIPFGQPDREPAQPPRREAA